MDLQSLLQLDLESLKTINWAQAKNDLLKRKDMLIIAVCVLVAPLICINVFVSKTQKKSSLNSEISLLERKQKTLTQLTESRKSLDETKKNFPLEIPDDELISKIASIANTHKINIANFSPLNTEDRGTFKLTSVVLTVIANDFESMWEFVNEIETLPYAIRIESWATNFSGYLTQFIQNPGSPKPPMTTRIVVGALHIK